MTVDVELQWVCEQDAPKPFDIWYAETGGGRYCVRRYKKSWRWLFYTGTSDDVPPTDVDSAEDGKEECEEHWREFVRCRKKKDR